MVVKILVNELTKMVPMNPGQGMNEYYPPPISARLPNNFESKYFPRAIVYNVKMKSGCLALYFSSISSKLEGGYTLGSPSVNRIKEAYLFG